MSWYKISSPLDVITRTLFLCFPNSSRLAAGSLSVQAIYRSPRLIARVLLHGPTYLGHLVVDATLGLSILSFFKSD